MKTLIIGDHFIPAEFYVAAIRDRLGPDFGPVITRDLEGSKAEQHHRQHQMELYGPPAGLASAELIAAERDAQLVVMHFAPAPAAAFAPGTSLRGAFAARAGVENIDVAAATAAGAAVVNVQGRNASGVAELALGLMLSEGRNIARAHASVAGGGWRKDFGRQPREVGGATVGLVGLGHVGRILASRLVGFDCELLVADPYVDPSVVASLGGKLVELPELFARSDYISLQARVTQETTGLIDERLIGLMKPTAYLVNVGRSRLVVYEHLLAALQEGRIAGAGLDVHDEEPLPPDSPWRSLANATLTTHFGGDTLDTNLRSARLVADAIATFVATGQVASAVNARELGWAA